VPEKATFYVINKATITTHYYALSILFELPYFGE